MAAPEGWVLRPGQWLENSEYLRSRNGLFIAYLNADGNFRINRGEVGRVRSDLFQSWGTSVYKNWAKKNDPKGGPSPGFSVAVMGTDGVFRVYQGVKHAEIRDHPERITMQGRDAGDGKLGIALENDGRLRVHSSQGTATFLTNESDRLVNEENIRWTHLEYDLQKATHVPIGPPKEFDTVEAENETDSPQEMSLAVAYTVTQSTSWKHTTGLKIGAKAEFGAGIPAIASTKVEVSAEVSYSFEWNRVNTSSKTKTMTFPVKVPAHSATIGQVTWQDNSITVPFTVKGVGKFASGVEVPISFHGVYEGTASSHLNGKWIPYKKGERTRRGRCWRRVPASRSSDPPISNVASVGRRRSALLLLPALTSLSRTRGEQGVSHQTAQRWTREGGGLHPPCADNLPKRA